jgi:hypothetical protein
MTEEDEAATSKTVALDNLREQIVKGKSLGVIDMYERAAWSAGASVKEMEACLNAARARPSPEKDPDPEGSPERLYRGWRLERY